ncbi:hypothetical protein EJ08DRAFT_655083 [Tothia fuscella]|uniref:Uncharacterized protein n=1 Tax=Tothia fuscella TaxID=1048955 RepID=A0A9P4U5F0_9PEZI|nr:hypothetical protein EJ08DRAFT_655083 [Tothia fuscella]
MAQSDSNRGPGDEEKTPKVPRTLDDHFNALFHTVVGLPAAIYNRGNEHGREWNRRYRGDGQVDDEDMAERRESRECRREGNSPASTRPLTGGASEDSDDLDEWVSGIMKELARGEEQAKEMYDWWSKMEGPKGQATQSSLQQAAVSRKNEGQLPISKGTDEWADLFPAWQDQKSPKAVIQRERQDVVEDTTDKFPRDVENWFKDAEKKSRQLQRGFERDSRLWENQGLFGPSMPFSKPLSTLFSLGMRPFFPQESAVGYLLYSEYSPLHLEYEEGFDESWRQRFEDLLRTQDGKKMLDERSIQSVSSSSGVEWLGKIMPLLKDDEPGKNGRITIGSASDHQAVVQVHDVAPPNQPTTQAVEAGIGPRTELDLSEHHFAQSAQDELKPRTAPPPASIDNFPCKKPDILLTLTKTERHVSPDGSVTTKTVLKKRFADGREEMSETMETIPRNVPRYPDCQASHANRQSDKNFTDKESKQRGWFWSS